MKLIITALLTISLSAATSQDIIIDSCGLDESVTLSKYEAQFFNHIYAGQRSPANFDFEHKKIGFFADFNGKRKSSKQAYFSSYKRNSATVSELIILTEGEKRTSGGYDAIIVTWSKVKIGEKRKEKLIKKLSRINLAG